MAKLTMNKAQHLGQLQRTTHKIMQELQQPLPRLRWDTVQALAHALYLEVQDAAQSAAADDATKVDDTTAATVQLIYPQRRRVSSYWVKSKAADYAVDSGLITLDKWGEFADTVTLSDAMNMLSDAGDCTFEKGAQS